MKPENASLEKEHHLPNRHFQVFSGAILIFRGVDVLMFKHLENPPKFSRLQIRGFSFLALAFSQTNKPRNSNRCIYLHEWLIFIVNIGTSTFPVRVPSFFTLRDG